MLRMLPKLYRTIGPGTEGKLFIQRNSRGSMSVWQRVIPLLPEILPGMLFQLHGRPFLDNNIMFERVGRKREIQDVHDDSED